MQAQTPLGINYQAVARDGDGALLREQGVDATWSPGLYLVRMTTSAGKLAGSAKVVITNK